MKRWCRPMESIPRSAGIGLWPKRLCRAYSIRIVAFGAVLLCAVPSAAARSWEQRPECYEGHGAFTQKEYGACEDWPYSAGRDGCSHCARLILQCWLEGVDVYAALQKMFIGLLINSQQEPACFRVATAGDMLDLVESALAYRICAVQYAEDDPDEDTIAKLQAVQKSILALAELLYIAELLTCR